MAYIINYTDTENNETITVVDNTLNEQTSLKFPGKNYNGYGPIIAENFLHLLENFASATEPSSPIEGQLWYDKSPNSLQLKLYDGTNWIPAGGLNKSASEPSNAEPGDLWADSENQQLYLFSGADWLLVGPDFADGLSTGTTPLNITGTDNEEYTIILVEVQAQPVAIISTAEFTPKTVIPGFTSIKPGVNLSNRNISGNGQAKFVGTSERAESLIVGDENIQASNFLRGDTTSTTLFPVNVQNNTGVRIGTDAALNIGVEGQAGIIQHQIEGSNIDVRVRSGGTSRTVLRVDSSRRLGINNEAPDEALDVIGNIQTDSNIFINGAEQSTEFNNGSLITKGGVGIAKNLNVGGNSQFANTATFANVVPDGNNTRNLGSPDAKWQIAYATEFRGNLTGTVNGRVTGEAGSALKLQSKTTFRLGGDLTAPDVIFDGQTGDSTKVFDATLSNAVISGRDEVFDSNTDDEILLNRVSGTTGLFKITRQSLFDSVPTNPPGVILPYAGRSVPSGWLLCDGSEYRISEFNKLYQVINYDYGQPSDPARFFRVPDLRGRMPLGADNMGGSSANRVTADSADDIGLSGGSENTTIDINNLPDHEHNFQDESNTQYYAIRDVAGTPEDSQPIRYEATSEPRAVQTLAKSGGVLNDDLGDPVDVMNPTLTLNYIIYTGG